MTAATASAPPGSPTRGLLARVVVAGLAGAAVDFVYATTVGVIDGRGPVKVWQGVAGGWIGKAARDGGLASAGLGLATHVGIATCMAAAYALGRDPPADPLPAAAVDGRALRPRALRRDVPDRAAAALARRIPEVGWRRSRCWTSWPTWASALAIALVLAPPSSAGARDGMSVAARADEAGRGRLADAGHHRPALGAAGARAPGVPARLGGAGRQPVGAFAPCAGAGGRPGRLAVPAARRRRAPDRRRRAVPVAKSSGRWNSCSKAAARAGAAGPRRGRAASPGPRLAGHAPDPPRRCCAPIAARPATWSWNCTTARRRELVAAVLDRELDAILIDAEDAPPGLDRLLLWSEPWLLARPLDAPDRARWPRPRRRCCARRRRLGADQAAGGDRGGAARRRARPDTSHDGVLGLVAAGAGHAIVPQSVAARHPRVVRFTPAAGRPASLRLARPGATTTTTRRCAASSACCAPRAPRATTAQAAARAREVQR